MKKVQKHRIVIIWWLLVLHAVIRDVKSAANMFIPPSTNINCVCPGDVLTYNCTTVGGGNTDWGGSAFDCPGSSNEISLRHSQYSTEGGTFGTCKNIKAKSIGVVGSCYTSQLNVTLDGDYPKNATVTCSHSSNDRETLIGSSKFNLVTAPYRPPSDVNLAKVFRDNITFNWTPVPSDCSTVVYTITSTDCGDCPSTTNVTEVTCNNTTVPSTCTLSIQTMICSFTGNNSDPVVIPLKIPDAPGVEEIIPHYSNDSQSLIKLTLNINQTSAITTHRELRTTNYNITYENSSTQTSTIISADSSCITEDCQYVVPSGVSSHCSSSASINVTVSAINVLGESPSSEEFSADCKSDSNFVKVEYNTEDKTVLCTFLNPLDTSQKSCSVRYGQCGQEMSQRMESESNAGGSANIISFKLNKEGVSQTLCYAITASNSTYIIIVEGDINIAAPDVTMNQIIIRIVVPLCVALLLLIAIVAILVVIVLVRKKQVKQKQEILTDVSNLHAQSEIQKKLTEEKT